MSVRTRFAPSPTGALHIGGVRTALFSWLFARHHGGEYVLRIEDTDQARSTRENVDLIVEGFDWLGVVADEGPYFQTDRLDRYREVAEGLVASGLAYRCYCSAEELAEMRADQLAKGLIPRYDGRCRTREKPKPGVTPIVRFRTPSEGQIVVRDLVHGDVTFDNAQLDDLVILRSSGVPTYHFGVVVDDHDMRITHVIRGDDHLNNTPRHIHLIQALGYALPAFAHIPMIAGPDGAKLSKRHGATNILEYREQGYLPDAMVNYLVRLGWSHGDQEIFSRDELIENFDLASVQKSAARFDVEKLNWVNQHYLKLVPAGELAERLAAGLAARGVDVPAAELLVALAEAFRERSKTLSELVGQAAVYLCDFDHYESAAADKFLTTAASPLLADLRDRLDSLAEWTPETTQACVAAVASDAGVGMGKVAQPLRVAVTGTAASPGIGVTLHLLGRERAIARIRRALDWIDARQAG